MFQKDLELALKKRDHKAKKLNYFHTSEVLKDMGFMFSDQDHNDKADERMLFIDFWRCLRGDENDGVDPANLRKLLLAIEGIQRTKPNIQERTRKAMMAPLDKIFNRVDFPQKGKMNIHSSETHEIRKHFLKFAQNRSNFLNSKITEKISKRHEVAEPTHKPKIDERSRKIVKKLHSKLDELKIPHFELLLYKGKEYDKRKEMNISKKEGKNNMVQKQKFTRRRQQIYRNYRENDDSKLSENSEIIELMIKNKPDSMTDYLDPKMYDSSNTTPEGSGERAASVQSNAEQRFDTSNFLNTSPILEEEYSGSMDQSGEADERQRSGQKNCKLSHF